jgi:hypothetical protein
MAVDGSDTELCTYRRATQRLALLTRRSSKSYIRMQSTKSGVSRLSAYFPMWPHASGIPQAGCQVLSRSDRDSKQANM